MIHMRWHVVALVAVVGGSACTSTAPKADLNGTWNYTAVVKGDGVTCTDSGAELTLLENGSTVTGSFTGLIQTCNGPGGFGTLGPYSGTVDGTVNGDAVSFEFTNPATTNTGTINGRSMRGAANTMFLGSLSGTWNATKN